VTRDFRTGVLTMRTNGRSRSALATCALVLILGFGCVAPDEALAAEKGSSAEVQVAVIRATQASFVAEIHVTGFLVARDEALVTLDMPGYKVSEVLVGEGDRVSSGQILARLTRLTGDVLDPRTDQRPPSLTLKAPAGGIITQSTAVLGSTASPLQTEPLFRIVVDNEIELEADVPSIHIPLLAPNQNARIEMENNREFRGQVRLVPGAVDPKTQLGRARVSLERDPRLRLGMFARATIAADYSRGISVPRSAVLYRTDGPTVQVVRGNVIETRLVRVGYHSDTDTEIREGLHEGDLVVANAGGSLGDGDKVKPVDADATRMGLR
jgi:multidrug efflux pump subunit AcrA (membrane-fusion protein)